MSSLVLRKCNSEKMCSSCEQIIPVGIMYHTGPNKSLCIKCHDEQKIADSKRERSVDVDYIISGNCAYCEHPAVGILWGKKTCSAHINQVITEEI